MKKLDIFDRMRSGDLSTYVDSPGEKLFRQGMIQYDSGFYNQALESFKESAKYTYGPVLLRAKILFSGLCYMQLKNYKMAIRQFIEGTEIFCKDNRDFLTLRDLCLCHFGVTVDEFYEKHSLTIAEAFGKKDG